ncbi:hypothetical protein E2C01_048143 [Portunus trituberculatus]|uniref:Uncharacterized protein n=1 Tax=Portunus trituberculatus TaxID=210409 RepID=A0A5B7GAD3_PORTR|nr:hypothetical protein [Portunus trituberculatus]
MNSSKDDAKSIKKSCPTSVVTSDQAHSWDLSVGKDKGEVGQSSKSGPSPGTLVQLGMTIGTLSRTPAHLVACSRLIPHMSCHLCPVGQQEPSVT